LHNHPFICEYKHAKYVHYIELIIIDVYLIGLVYWFSLLVYILVTCIVITMCTNDTITKTKEI